MELISLLKRIFGCNKSAIELIADKCECDKPCDNGGRQNITSDIDIMAVSSEVYAISEFEMIKVNIGTVNIKLPKKIRYNNGDCLEIKYLNKRERSRKERWINNMNKSYIEVGECL